MAEYDISGARESGVGDAEIADTLAPKMNYDIAEARKAGVPDKEIADTLAQKFNTTQGGAATGNPNIRRQGEKANRYSPSGGEVIGQIGGAAGVGAALGAVAPELLTGAGAAASAFPPTAPMGPPLMFMGRALRGQRVASGISGAVSGAASETAGQAVEAGGGGVVPAEVARIVAGGITPEFKNLAVWGAKKALGASGVTDLLDAARKYMGKDVKLSDAQNKYLEEQISALRGGAKNEASLEGLGNRMEARGAEGIDSAAAQTIAAQRQREGVRSIGSPTPRDMADIGGDLRTGITAKQQKLLDDRATEYTANETARDALVVAQESHPDVMQRKHVNQLPEYQSMIDNLKADLAPGKRSPDVQAGIQKMLAQLQNPEKDVFGQPKAVSFQQLDDVRRKLGDVFKGKAAEGYDAIGEVTAKDLYSRISDIQKKFAGGENGPHAKLLQDYANSSEALAPFRSRTGKPATALDTYNSAEHAKDASGLPSVYFKTRASMQALKELTGNSAVVNKSAADYASNEIRDLDGQGVRNWMTKNREWLGEVPVVRGMVDNYATKIEAAERSAKNAEMFAKRAADNYTVLTKDKFQVSRAKDLLESGSMRAWDLIAPVIKNSPEAKQQTIDAFRQVLADKARSPDALIDFFNRKMVEPLERTGISNRQELDYLRQRIQVIKDMNVPEPEKLGIMRRVLLQASAGWASSAASRGGNTAYQWSKENMVPQ